jgi:hypothetical protein
MNGANKKIRKERNIKRRKVRNKRKKNKKEERNEQVCEISSFRSDENSSRGLLGCDAV